MIKQKTQKYLQTRFIELSQKATELNAKIAEAKTDLKRQIYMKKLKKNNLQALDVLRLIQASQSTAIPPEPNPADTGIII